MKLTQLAIVMALISWLSGCSTVKQAQVASSTPVLKIEEFFIGETFAWGLFTDRFGKVRRQFNVRIDGVFDAGVLTLDEHFCYADGERDRRVWRIRPTGENRYVGEADDVEGQAIGESYGNSLHWEYRVNLKMGERSLNVAFDDWMFLQPGNVLINRAEVKKFGLKLGEVALFFGKWNPGADWDAQCR